LRQRMDANAAGDKVATEEAAIELLRRSGARFTPLNNGLTRIDYDATPFDNSRCRKDAVSLTYKGVDSYAPMATYLGQEGYCLEFALREGAQTSDGVKGTTGAAAVAYLLLSTLPGVTVIASIYGKRGKQFESQASQTGPPMPTRPL
jgi:hypothetical protein